MLIQDIENLEIYYWRFFFLFQKFWWDFRLPLNYLYLSGSISPFPGPSSRATRAGLPLDKNVTNYFFLFEKNLGPEKSYKWFSLKIMYSWRPFKLFRGLFSLLLILSFYVVPDCFFPTPRPSALPSSVFLPGLVETTGVHHLQRSKVKDWNAHFVSIYIYLPNRYSPSLICIHFDIAKTFSDIEYFLPDRILA